MPLRQPVEISGEDGGRFLRRISQPAPLARGNICRHFFPSGNDAPHEILLGRGQVIQPAPDQRIGKETLAVDSQGAHDPVPAFVAKGVHGLIQPPRAPHFPADNQHRIAIAAERRVQGFPDALDAGAGGLAGPEIHPQSLKFRRNCRILPVKMRSVEMRLVATQRAPHHFRRRPVQPHHARPIATTGVKPGIGVGINIRRRRILSQAALPRSAQRSREEPAVGAQRFLASFVYLAQPRSSRLLARIRLPKRRVECIPPRKA
jgi:hypothetical protein